MDTVTIDEFVKEYSTNKTPGHFVTRHFDEIKWNSAINPDSEEALIAGFQHLIDACRSKISTSTIILLIIPLGETTTFNVPSFDDAVRESLKLDEPPSLYILNKDFDGQPYVSEEYIKLINLSSNINLRYSGKLLAYYRAHKDEGDEAYSQNVYIENYPFAI